MREINGQTYWKEKNSSIYIGFGSQRRPVAAGFSTRSQQVATAHDDITWGSGSTACCGRNVTCTQKLKRRAESLTESKRVCAMEKEWRNPQKRPPCMAPGDFVASWVVDISFSMELGNPQQAHCRLFI